jgi:murein DD-endopeptidase MepM/ murein hydrolase activator NlpD
VITGKFGKHEHPVFEKVMTENLGVDIRTNRNEPARAIFAGKIVSISQMSGLGYVVMIRHGEFVTVYTRLKSVSVAKGATVGIKDQIGIVGLNDEGFPELQFQIWRNQTRLNPEEWLAKY